MPELSRPVQPSSAKDMFEGAYAQYEERWRPFSKGTVIGLFAAVLAASFPYLFVKNYDALLNQNPKWFLCAFSVFSAVFISVWWFVDRREKKRIMNSVKWQKIHLAALIKEYEETESAIPGRIKQAEDWAEQAIKSLKAELKQAKAKKAEVEELLKTFD